MTDISLIQTEIATQVADQNTAKALLATAFKGMSVDTMKQALLEGMMRGFEFKDFLKKNVYAIGYGGGYSLVTSIDYARKIGMRSGVVGTDAPSFTYNADGTIETCTVTVKRKFDDYIGGFTATVHFKEYSTGKNLWATKAHTMIAKVGEFHALRMACPEELAQIYDEDEIKKTPENDVVDITQYKIKLENVKTLDELKTVWASLPVSAKSQLEEIKNQIKQKYEENTADTQHGG